MEEYGIPISSEIILWYDIHEGGWDLVLPLGILDMALVLQFCK